MKYQVLDKESIPDYLEKIPEIVEILGENRELEIEEIGDGNLNFVFKITNKNNSLNQIILKQAVPYLRMVGENWPLSKDRMNYEIRALQFYNEIIPKNSPAVFYSDEEMSLVIMQCLSDHIILRYGMIDQIFYPHLTDHISTILAETLFKTSSLYLSSEEKRKMMTQFALNTELCKLTEDFVFSFPFVDHESNYENPHLSDFANELRKDTKYKMNVLKFKDLFMNKTDALLHGDIHTGSLMVSQDETYAIDPEFAFFGPFGFDVGKIMGNFLLSYVSHYYHSEDSKYQDWILKGFFELWEKFSSKFLTLWEGNKVNALVIKGFFDDEELSLYKKAFMNSLLKETIGFAGCSMARRTMGIAGVVDIRGIEDIKIRSELEIINLKISQLLINNHQDMNSLEDLRKLLLNFLEGLSVNIEK